MSEAVADLEQLVEGIPHAQDAGGLRQEPFDGAVGEEDFLSGAEGGY